MNEYVTRTATLTRLDGEWWCARMEFPMGQSIAVDSCPIAAWKELQRRGWGDLVPGDAATRAVLIRALDALAASMPAWVPGPLGNPQWLEGG